MSNTMHMRNVAITDIVFECNVGSWNVTRAERDCRAGLYPTMLHDVAALCAMNKAVEVDEAKVAAFAAVEPSKFPPLILVAEVGAWWLIDGHHRVRALHRRGVQTFAAYMIAEPDAVQYRVTYNRERVAPWQAKGKRART